MPFHFDYHDDMYPATDFNQINLNWILQLAEQLKQTAESGGFDGAPGTPGTATNGIAYFNYNSTYSDLLSAISDGQLPVYVQSILGNPTFFICTDHGAVWSDFIAFYNSTLYLVRWNVNNNKQTYTYDFATLASPQFTGNPTAPTQAVTDSSNRLATTSFVQNAVTTAVQAAIEQLVIAPFSENFKQALLTLAEKVAYIDSNGATYYQALYDALYPPINIDYIECHFNPGGHTVYDTDTLDSLKPYLNVVAYYDDQTSETLASDAYVLSGSLTVGTSTITATYAGATDTFTVTVVANEVVDVTAVFTQSGALILHSDTLDSLKQYLTVTAEYTNGDIVTLSSSDYVLSGTLTAGTPTITVTYDGESDTFNPTVTYGFKFAGALTKAIGSGNYNVGVGANLTYYTNNTNRRCFFLTEQSTAGEAAVYDAVAQAYTNYYPIPVPATATTVTITFAPATQYFAPAGWVFANGAYTRTFDPGWQQTPYTTTFTAGTYDFFTIWSKYNSAGSSYPTEPESCIITFE